MARIIRELDLSNSQVTDISPLAGVSSLERLNLSDTQVTDLSPLLPMLRATGMPLIEVPEGLSEEQHRLLAESTTIPAEEMKRIAPTGLTLVICNADDEVLDTLVIKPDIDGAEYEFRISEKQREIRVFAVGSRIMKSRNYEVLSQNFIVARDQNKDHAGATLPLGESLGESVGASLSGGNLDGFNMAGIFTNEPRALKLTQKMRNQIHADIVADKRTMPIFVETEASSPGQVTFQPVK